ncbi:MAG: TolB protein [Actinomycetota bacterium]|nr:TolB protein [Actinomycetota bacterium]
MRRTLVIVVLAVLSILAVAPADVTAAAAARESRIYYSACPGTISNGTCKDNNGKSLPTEIMRIGPNGYRAQRVTFNATFEQDLIWSPSGRSIVFERTGSAITCDYGSHLARIAASGSPDEKTLTASGNYRCDEPTDWAPDGGRFLFDRMQNVCEDVVSVRRDGSHRSSLTRVCGEREDPDEYAFDGNWARDGSRVIYRMNVHDETGDGIYIMRANGTNRHKVKLGGRAVGDVDVSPGSHTLAFAVYTKDGASLFTSNLNGDHVQRIDSPDGVVDIQYIRWSPDGKKILYVGQEGGGLGSLYVVNRDRGNPTKLDGPALDAVSSREIYGGYWSPDSTRVTFVAEDHDFNGHALAVMDVDGSNLEVLTRYEKNLYVWGWERLP